MTISDNYTPDKSIGDGSTTDFSGSWSVLSASYFRLYLETIATGAQDLQELDVDYTLSFDDDGYVATMVVPPTSSYNVIRARDVAQEQNVPYKTSKGFQGIVQEGSFDKLTAMGQDQQDQINRSLTFPIGSTAVGSIPEPVDDKPIGWDGVSGSVKNGSMTLADIQGAIDAVAALSAASGVKVSSNDATVGFLNGKLIAGSSFSFTENNDGGPETLTLNMNDMAQATIKGRASGAGTGAPTDLTGAQARTILVVYSTAEVDAAIAAAIAAAPKGALVLLEPIVADDDASVEFTGFADDTLYSRYFIEFNGVYAAVNTASLRLTMSQDDGSTYLTSYRDSGTNSVSSVTIASAISDGAAASANGRVDIFSQDNAADYTAVLYETVHFTTSVTGALSETRGKATALTVGVVDAFKIFCSSGNITAGTFRIFGVRK